MKKNIYLLLLMMPFFGHTSHSSHYEKRLIEVDKYLTSNIRSGFSGVALIADKNGIIFHKSYGNKSENIKLSTGFYIASISKVFTAIAILQLAEQRKLSLDDHIHKYFSEVPQDKKVITLRDLLTHTSGLSDCGCLRGDMNVTEIIKAVFTNPMINEPGKKWNYLNENYMLLGEIVEKVSGLPYTTYIRKYVLNRGAMNSTGEWGNESAFDLHIADLQLDSLKKQPRYQWAFKNGRPAKLSFHGAGGYFSTSSDLYKFSQAIRQGNLISKHLLRSSLDTSRSALIRRGGTSLYHGYGWVFTVRDNKIKNFFVAGREDWVMNCRLYLLDNGYTIIVWSKDKTGPEKDAIATTLSQHLVELFEKINS